ncbi:MAG TPA: SRPBCC domain-containing protein [Rhodocyclaceae bacterium]|nr:SRPBCC domain-containing protein [Rhodocyclaceae bacterium]
MANPVANTATSTETTANEFVLSRVFDAPRDLVWSAWTDEKHLAKWFGPKGFTMKSSKHDLRPGGIYHYCMMSPDGHEMWGKWVFREINAPERLVIVNSFSDANGNLTRHPMSPTWPLETLATTTLTESGGKTTLRLQWLPINASAEEIATFNAAHAGMEQGWGGTMEQLTAYLASVQASR